MSILSILVVVVVVGVALWGVSFIPMDAIIHNILRAVVVVILVVWLLQAFGLISASTLRLH
jgi:hypothetical protein